MATKKKIPTIDFVRKINSLLFVFCLIYTILFFSLKGLRIGDRKDNVISQSKELILVGVSGIITFSFFKFPARRV